MTYTGNCDILFRVERIDIDLKTIITRDELDAWRQLSELNNDEGAYDTCINRWQRFLSDALFKKQKAQAQIVSEYAERMANFTKGSAVIIAAAFVVYIACIGIDAMVKKHDAIEKAQSSRMQQSGYFDESQAWSNTQILDAPEGVKMQSWAVDSALAGILVESNITYVLWLPKLPDNQAYSITHTLVTDTNSMVSSGLFYTKPKEYGFCRFTKKIENNNSTYAKWIKIGVKIVDAGDAKQ